jgi:glycosyltransferase involved in cell wall biosynthesis
MAGDEGRDAGSRTAVRSALAGNLLVAATKAGAAALTGSSAMLSEALAACALECGMTLVERHAHTARIERAAAAPDAIDATVSWNYVDLRVSSPFAWRLEVELTGDELVVRVRAAQAGAGAGRLVTPHADVARHLRGLGLAQVECLDWIAPVVDGPRPPRRAEAATPLVAFPASALARKGAHELAQALRQLNWRLLVLGTPSTDADLWRGIDVQHAGYRDATWMARADVVALPAHVEHAPRALLRALAHGLPLVATAACGLAAVPGWREVVPGDVDGLVAALEAALGDARARTPGFISFSA